MKRFKTIGAAALVGAAIALSGCATGLPTKVTRYSAMPIPAGQTFYVVPAAGQQTGLEFGSFASLVAQQLQAKGYRPAASAQTADLLVRVDYGIDEGRTEYTTDPFARSRYADTFYRGAHDPFYRGAYDPFYRGAYDPFYRGAYDPFYRGAYDPFYRPYWGRPIYSRYGYWGARSPFYYGWDDPFWYASPYAGYGGGYAQPIRSYTVYKSQLDLNIVRRVDNAPLFQGRAQARSQTDELGTLVPNLVEAMFTNFPGRNGETVRITVPARR